MDYIKAFSAADLPSCPCDLKEIYKQFHFNEDHIASIEKHRNNPNDGLEQADKNRIALLQEKLKDNQFLYLSKSGSWPGEYVARTQEYLWWLTGFSGSSAYCIIGKNTAILFSDSRYAIQAPLQAPHMQFIDTAQKTPQQWLCENTNDSHEICIAGWLTPIDFYDELKKNNIKNITVFDDFSLMDNLWTNRLPLPYGPVWAHELNHAGKGAAEKIADGAKILAQEGLDGFIITQPENIAWLLNIRSCDVKHTPIALSFAVLWKDGHVDWYMDKRRLTLSLQNELKDFVNFYDSDALKTADFSPYAIGYNAPTTVVSLHRLIAAKGKNMPDPTLLPKACKNSIEQQGIRDAHIIDGVVMVRFLHWLEQEIPGGKLTELSAAEKLNSLRLQHKACHSVSFDTISASGPHAALPHYRVSAQSNRPLRSDEIYLIDSGGQYTGGTTDITRTIKLSHITAEEKTAFTLVLKGVIALFMPCFAQGSLGSSLDKLARKALNDHGMDYGHGTGHGVGCYLGVHEGPQSISVRGHQTPLQDGMVCSIEPGYYKENHFGIRTENLAIVQSKDGQCFFENITYCPIDTRLIELSLLSADEKNWLNGYHKEVRHILTPLLGDDIAVIDWLKQATEDI